MTASEIASGAPLGQTYADNRIFLLVESEQANSVIAQLVDEISKLPHPTLSNLSKFVDQSYLHTMTILLLVQDGQNVHIVSRGNGTIFLKRGEKAAPLVTGNTSATGPLTPYDIFILAGNAFLSAVTPSVFTILLEKTPESGVEEKIINYLEQNAKTDVLCLLTQNVPEEKTGPVIHELPDLPRRKFLPAFELGNIFSSFSPQSKQQKLTVIVGTILLVLLVGSLVFGSRERKRANTVREFETLATSVAKNISDVEQLVDIAPEQAEPLIAQTLDTLKQAEEKFPEKTPQHDKLAELMISVENLQKRARRIYSEEPTVFFDITWVKDTGKGTKFALSPNNLFILDRENKSLYKIGLTQKKSEIIATNELFKDGVALVLFQEKPYVFVEGQNPRMVNEKGEEVITHNDSWGVIPDSKSYGGNIYLLDRNNQIWKHPGSESGFGSGGKWLTEDSSVDFSSARSLAVDGNIWVLGDTNISKLTMGGQDPFFIKNEVLTHGKTIWTSEESKYLYVLDDNRVVVFDKEGNYKQQYIWDGLTDTTDIAIAESLNKILILKDDKVYALDIKS